MTNDQDRLLALAGIFQAACLVDQIARHGTAQSDALETSIFSIFQTDADSVEAVFHSRENLKTGLQCIVRQMTENHTARIDITRYVLQLMHLAGKLVKSTEKLKALADGINLAKARAESFPITHTNILAQLADLYSENISNLSSRIMVNGEPLHLNNPDNVHKIRALLLAGIRASWLWQQCGGRRFHMIFFRRRILLQAETLLKEM
jgi:high frequency lysogenization protein